MDNISGDKIFENIIFLKKTDLFSSMDTVELKELASITIEEFFEKGSTIVLENEIGNSMYIIKNGVVTITKQNNSGELIELATLGDGEAFGEMALFDAELRSATVVASKDCILLRVSGDELNDLLLDYPTIAVEFVKVFVSRLRDANRKIEYFKSRLDGGKS